MIISYQWLLEYLPEPLPLEDLSKILTAIGLEVEAIERTEAIKGGLEGLVIGEVVTSAPHPNADKLKVTTVNTGQGPLVNIVCGAPNVAAGQKVIVATIGTMVHPVHGEPFLIKKAKIRGVESEGMICAEDEIGLGESHEGIMILPDDAPVGMKAKSYFHLSPTDFAIHIGLTPNRSDANSHIGVARDVCAYLTHHSGVAQGVKLPEIKRIVFPAKDAKIVVEVKAPGACPRYMGLCLAGVTIGPSPDWLVQRLQTIDVRPINNVVDITNYILHEYGQPLHAFDADSIKGGRINIGFLTEGTPFTTLDGKERKLRDTDLMICDAEEGICIAGVFGGMHSGITDATTNIFLESAYFDPAHVRRTSLYHGLRTDAATHFEKGVDINNLEPALLRAAQMMMEMAGASVDSEVTDIYPKPLEPAIVTISYDYIQKLSGKSYEPAVIQNLLKALGFGITQASEKQLILRVPSNKPDVSQPADIVEEILRIDGLDNVIIPQRLNISLGRALPNDREEREKVAQGLSGMGFQEIITNSIVNSKYYPEQDNLVRMLNSLSSELDVMRPSMLESGLEVISYNVNRKNNDLLLFEAGHIYRKDGASYIQEPQLALYTTGLGMAGNWQVKLVKADVYFLKGVIQNLLKSSGIQNTALSFEGETMTWKWKNQALANLMPVPPQKLQLFDIRQEVCFAFIDWTLWMKAASANTIRFAEVPRFPAVQRDLAIIIDKGVPYQQVQKVTEKLKLPGLQSFDLFDVFESEKIGTDKKSLALSYTFQLQDRTLTDAETEALMLQLTEAYRKELQAQIRE